jgi:dTDP-4-dehydrorhamnose reductase
MKLLLLGANGQVGWELQRSLAPLGELISLSRASTDYCGDFLNPTGLAQTVRSIKPDVVINAAAYTSVDKAESDIANAYTVNADAPGAIAQAAHAVGARLIHYSTDYVFNGSGTKPWDEADTPGPLSVYGASKLQGEQAITVSGVRHLIFRTSWVYAARGGNFAKTMLRLSKERDALSVISDQMGAPTGADLLADITAQSISRLMASDQLSGIYHLAAAGETSWHSYAQHVFAQARLLGVDLKLKAENVTAIPTSAYPTPAQRPLNSRLDCSKLKSLLSIHLPHWQTGVNRMLYETL